MIYSIYRTFPDYIIVNDKYLYTQEEGDMRKKKYNLKIKKSGERCDLSFTLTEKFLKSVKKVYKKEAVQKN